MALHRHFVWAVEQEAITHNGNLLVANRHLLLCSEQFRVVAFGPQTARIVLQILEHGVELSTALQDAVVVTLFPERR